MAKRKKDLRDGEVTRGATRAVKAANNARRPAGKSARAKPAAGNGNRRGGGSTPKLIVGLVASAGGIEAFCKFFDALPHSTGLAFVVVPHLDPRRHSVMAELLVRHTKLPVREATDGDRIEAEHVYVIAPNTALTVAGGAIRLKRPMDRDSSAAVMDTFLISLAEDRQEKAVAVVLSGTGTWGTVGAKAIKAHGGVVIVQDPASATHDGMPRAAIAAGVADLVVAPEAMPRALIECARVADAGAADAAAAAAADQLALIVALLRARTRFDFHSYRKTMLLRRIQRRMGLNHVETLAAYVDVLRNNSEEVRRLSRDLHVSVTTFFRDPEAYHQLEAVVVPDLLHRVTPETTIRVWVPACATGEEVYSLAMLFMEKISKLDRPCGLQVFGTDVDSEALDMARQGAYPAAVLAQVGAERFARFFVKVDDNRCQVNKALREKVLFAQQNILGDAPFSKVDLVSCRNLLIYLEPEVQQRVVGLLHFALNPGGYLLLGPSETVGPHADLFTAVSKRWRLFRRRETQRRGRFEFPIETGAEKGEWRPVTAASPAGPTALGPAIEHALLEAYAPASIVIDSTNYEAVYFHGPTNQYLQLPSGRPTHELTALVREGLRERLRAAVHKATREGRPAAIGGARIKRNRHFVNVRITARPLPGAQPPDRFMLVSFEDEVATLSVAHLHKKGRRDEVMVASQLEHELKNTRDALQATIEELERANEELKTSNEEVMSMNEELQSTNEELETSKEELQSLNEELTTVNGELQEKLAQLEAANNDLANLMASADTPTVFLGPDHTIKRFTSAATRLFRLIESDIGRPIGDINWRFDDAEFEADADEVLHTLAPREKEIRAEDGRWYLRRVTPYRTADHHIEGVVSTFTDVTVARLAQDVLRDSNELLEQRVAERTAELAGDRNFMSAVLETVAALVVVLDARGRIVRCNKACETVCGRRHEDVVGRSIWDVGLIPKDESDDVRMVFARLRDGEDLVRHENHWLSADGSSHLVAWTIAALRKPDGSIDYFIKTGVEVTDQRRAESEAREHQAALFHAHRTMAAGELAGALAHEVNQPLTVIANLCEATLQQLRGENPSPMVSQNLQAIAAQVQRAGHAIHELRAFIARRDVARTAIDINVLAGTARDLIGAEAARRGIRLDFDLAAERLVANVAAIHVEHTMVNLLQNAIDAIVHGGMPNGRIALKTSRGKDGAIEVSISDNGPGFPYDDPERAFDPFSTTKNDGLGLGLSIARSVIEANDGRLWLESTGPNGSTLRFSLPGKE